MAIKDFILLTSSYLDLMEYIERLEKDPIRSAYVRRTELCQTIAQNTCDLLTITAKDSVLPAEEKKGKQSIAIFSA